MPKGNLGAAWAWAACWGQGDGIPAVPSRHGRDRVWVVQVWMEGLEAWSFSSGRAAESRSDTHAAARACADRMGQRNGEQASDVQGRGSCKHPPIYPSEPWNLELP